MGSLAGAQKVAAKKAGLSLAAYLNKIATGQKRCIKCKRWRSVSLFNTDRSRADGRTARCSDCTRVTVKAGPTRRERTAKRAIGQNWCARCAKWLPLADVVGGLCRKHRNERDRKRYACDPIYRAERIANAYRRKRGVEPVPIEGVQAITEEFGGRCAYCPAAADMWDHIFPVEHGGKTTPGNIVPACRSCNSRKQTMDIEEWIERCADLHPRFTEREMLAHCGLYG